MKQTHWTMLGSLLLVLGVLLAFAPTLSAQEENTSRQNRAPHRGLLEVAADELGMTRAALVAELEQNRSIAEVATEQGVAPTTIIDAALVQPTEQMQQAVADGRMTQEEADARLAEHRTRITTAVNTPGLPQRPAGERAPHRGLLEVAADELGMTRAALVAELEQNRSIAEVATEQGVAPTTIIDAALVQPTEQMQQAVADGRMTQEEADARLAEHRTRITTAVNTPGLPQRPERAPRGPHPRGQ